MLTTDMGFIFLESQPTELAFKVLPHMIAKKTILWYGKTKKISCGRFTVPGGNCTCCLS
jgi:hypothetical protein